MSLTVIVTMTSYYRLGMISCSSSVLHHSIIISLTTVVLLVVIAKVLLLLIVLLVLMIDIDGLSDLSILAFCRRLWTLLLFLITWITLEQFFKDVVLFPRQLGWRLLDAASIKGAIVHRLRVLNLVEDFVDAKFDSSDFTRCHCILAHVGIVVQDKLELFTKELLCRPTAEATAFEEESQGDIFHQLSGMISVLVIIIAMHLSQETSLVVGFSPSQLVALFDSDFWLFLELIIKELEHVTLRVDSRRAGLVSLGLFKFCLHSRGHVWYTVLWDGLCGWVTDLLVCDQLAYFPVLLLVLWLVHGHYVSKFDLVALWMSITDEKGAKLD